MTSTFAEHQLPNGLRIVVESMSRVRSAAAALAVKTGARDEVEEIHGVSHFLEHMCFKGTPTRTSRDINIRFDELGSIYNAFTGKEHTVYYGWVPAERVEEQIELLADILRPTLPPEDFETERKVILEEIAMAADSFDHQVWNFLHETVFGHQPLAHEILGEKETIERLPRERLLDYHQRRYTPENVIAVVSGSVDPQTVFAAFGRACGGWKSSNGQLAERTRCKPALQGVHRKVLPQFKQQSVIVLYPSVEHGHADEETIHALTSILGGANSRCYWNIVQKGIAVQAGAVWLSYRDCGMLALYADGEPERCEAMLDALRHEAREITTGGLKPGELDRVKNQRRTQLALEGESPRTRLMQLIDDVETRGAPRTVEQRLAAAQAVTEERIADYLRRFPITGNGMLLCAGPRGWPP